MRAAVARAIAEGEDSCDRFYCCWWCGPRHCRGRLRAARRSEDVVERGVERWLQHRGGVRAVPPVLRPCTQQGGRAARSCAVLSSWN